MEHRCGLWRLSPTESWPSRVRNTSTSVSSILSSVSSILALCPLWQNNQRVKKTETTWANIDFRTPRLLTFRSTFCRTVIVHIRVRHITHAHIAP